ncbi:NUT family member 2-like [Polypterus senegalus]|nr:NUT family member 2-like [Polypterus senegalus]
MFSLTWRNPLLQLWVSTNSINMTNKDCKIQGKKVPRKITKGPTAVTTTVTSMPVEAAEEYFRNMEELVGRSGNEVEFKKPPEESDSEFLKYLDRLCGDKEFVMQVEAVINPQFVDELLSLDDNCDLSYLLQDWERKVGLSPYECPMMPHPGPWIASTGPIARPLEDPFRPPSVTYAATHCRVLIVKLSSNVASDH